MKASAAKTAHGMSGLSGASATSVVAKSTATGCSSSSVTMMAIAQAQQWLSLNSATLQQAEAEQGDAEGLADARVAAERSRTVRRRLAQIGAGAVGVLGIVCITAALMRQHGTHDAKAGEHEAVDLEGSGERKCTFVSMGLGTTCKVDRDDHTFDGEGTTNVKTLAPQAECQNWCDTHDSCTGYEYRSTEMRCEIWHLPIGYSKPAQHPFEFECKRKKCDS